MATYISDDPKLLDELFRKDGEGQLLVGYETGKEKPHAESSYMLYPANPDRQDPVYTFMALFSQQSIKAKYSAFVPNTRLEIYSFPKMIGCTGYLRRIIFQKGIISIRYYYPISGKRDWLL